MNASAQRPTAPLLGLLQRGLASSRPVLSFADVHGRTPSGVASFSADDLIDGATALALWLRDACQVQPGERVAWLGHNHPHQLLLLLALAQLGAVLVPLNFRLAPAEWDAVLADCGACLVVHDLAWREAAGALAARHRLRAIDATPWRETVLKPRGLDRGVDARAGAWGGVRPLPAHIAADTPVLLVYTSGTTGQPKGAVHTQANLLANARIAAQVQGIAPDDRVLTVLPLFHVGGLCIQTLPALQAGALVMLHERFDPEACLQAIAAWRPTLTLLVPATLKALIEHPLWPTTDLSSLRAVWAGSSVIAPALIEAVHGREVPVCNVYGATETGPFSIALDATHARSHTGSCGWPAPEVEVRLHQARADGVGELLLRGPNVVAHYWPAQAAVDDEGWFHSGDLAQQAADGSWTIVGRAKDMIISGGENIYPAEIENLLARHPQVAECAVIGEPDARWGEAVVAVLVARAGQTIDTDALQRELATQLARYKLPRRYLITDALPRTALGKVQKNLLIERLAQR